MLDFTGQRDLKGGTGIQHVLKHCLGRRLQEIHIQSIPAATVMLRIEGSFLAL